MKSWWLELLIFGKTYVNYETSVNHYHKASSHLVKAIWPRYLLPKILPFWQNCTSSLTSLVPWNLWHITNPRSPWYHLYDDLYQLLKDIVSNFIKPDLLGQCKNACGLCDTDFLNIINQLKKPETGFGASRLHDEKAKRHKIAQNYTKALLIDW